MANAFGGFLHKSPLSCLSSSTASPPDPAITLASNCIRDFFGPSAQAITDCLQSRGPSTLSELVANIRQFCLKASNEERARLVDRLNSNVGNSSSSKEKGSIESNGNSDVCYYRGEKVHLNKARGSEMAGFVTDASHVRAALIVLIHHSLVSVSGGGGAKHPAGGGKNKGQESDDQLHKPDPTSPQTHYTYTFLHDRARLLPRYPRYVEHVQNIMDGNASHIVESLLVNGRMRSEEIVQSAWEAAQIKLNFNGDEDDNQGDQEKGGNGAGKEPRPGNKVKLEDGDSNFDSSSNQTPQEVISSSSLVNEKESNNKKESEKNKALIATMRSFQKLIEGGYIEMVKPIATAQEMEEMYKEKEKQDGIHGGEVEFDLNADGSTIVAGKKRKVSEKASASGSSKKPKVGFVSQTSSNSKSYDSNGNNEDDDDNYGNGQPVDPQVKSQLSSSHLRNIVPPGSVYRVNIPMFHASIRAKVLGRFVSEIYGTNSKSSNNKNTNGQNSDNLAHVGDIVTAALIYTARQEHAPIEQILGINETEEEKHLRMSEWGSFTPADIIPYIPPEVTKILQSQVGGSRQNLSSTLVRMSKFQYPPVVFEVEEARGHPSGGKFEICTRQLLQRFRERILHRVISSHHGLVAARIVSILQLKGHCESDSIAEDVMMPAKDAREILHRIYRDGYINLFDMHMTKQHNAGTAIYLWNVIPSRLLRTVIKNVCTATLNLRLRRQHEVEVGKDWMDRAKEAGATEENVHEMDKKKYHAFCKGLERLDCACLQLDETLMVLKDF